MGMAKKTTKASNAKRSATKKTASKSRPVKSTKVDYYPNRMTVAISALAGTALVLLALISVYGAYRGW